MIRLAEKRLAPWFFETALLYTKSPTIENIEQSHTVTATNGVNIARVCHRVTRVITVNDAACPGKTASMLWHVPQPRVLTEFLILANGV